MKQLKIAKGVKQFYVYNEAPIVVYSNIVNICGVDFESKKDDDYFVRNGVLTKSIPNGLIKYKQYKFNGNKFEEEHSQYARNTYFDNNSWLSTEYTEGVIRVALTINGESYLFDIKDKKHANIPYFSFRHDILVLTSDKSLLFYTKTGQRLWEYKEEDENLKINGRCIPVVDDVVVVISMRGLRPEKIQGFNIHTGERLWGITSEGKGVSNTLFVGEDKILYGCMRPFASNGLVLTSLNPFTGELIKHVISEEDGFEVMPWLVTMHGRQLYYTDNRRGNEIGVIDVDKCELIERVPLNIKKKVTIGAPVVTDDKVYVFISDLQELRVFEK